MYLLDTNILSECIKRHPNPSVLSQLGSTPAHLLFTSCICIMELRFGSVLREDAEAFWEKVNQEIISRVSIVPITEREAIKAGNILAELRKKGESIGLEDILIAASAIMHQYTVVTANIRHFSRIGGLKVVNWLETI